MILVLSIFAAVIVIAAACALAAVIGAEDNDDAE
jgi:hypothetical protein